MPTPAAADAVFVHNLRELGRALGQLLNVLVCLCIARRGWSDETLSAHVFRSPSACAARAVIDAIFRWQRPDTGVLTDAGLVARNHCERAYFRERARRPTNPEHRTRENCR